MGNDVMTGAPGLNPPPSQVKDDPAAFDEREFFAGVIEQLYRQVLGNADANSKFAPYKAWLKTLAADPAK